MIFFTYRIRCDAWYKVIAILAVLGRASVIVVFTARTYAVYGQNRYILAYLIALGLATVITDTMHVPGQKCHDSTKTPVGVYPFHTSSALLITIRTIKAFKAYGPLGTKKSNILYLIFEEGLTYFCIISIFTIATFVLKLRAPPGFFQDILNAFTLPLSGILTARFILHLKVWKEKESFKMTGRDEEGNDYHPHEHIDPQSSHLPRPPPAMLHISSHNEVSTLAGETNFRKYSHASPSSPQSVSDSSTLVSSPWTQQDSEFGDDPMVSMAKAEKFDKHGSGAGSSFWMDESAPVTSGGRRGSEGQRGEKPIALQFGAGNIGRGFIGAVLSQAGFHVVFADVQEPIVNEINKNGQYDLHILEGRPKIETVKDISAVLSTNLQAFEDIAKGQLTIITTAVGPNILPRLAKPIAQIIRTRMAENRGPINIVACENAQRASHVLRDAVDQELSDQEREYARDNIGYAVCSVDRIVPPYDTENLLDVGVEPFYEWIVDANSLKKTDPDVQIPGMKATDNLDAYVQRKLFTLNTGHAITAFLGALPSAQPSAASSKSSLSLLSMTSASSSGRSTPTGAKIPSHPTILEAINSNAIRDIVSQALHESGEALIRKHGFTKEQHEEYISKILARFANPNMQDEVARVGREPLRKLKKGDRFLGPIEMCREMGLPRDALLIGVASALLFNPKRRTKSRTSSRGSLTVLAAQRPVINGRPQMLAAPVWEEEWEWEEEEADEQAKAVYEMIAEKGVVGVLRELTAWEEDDEDLKKVVRAYETLFKEGIDGVAGYFQGLKN
ncbi:mannitol-1-phosphate 5-dehydrogenase [Moniliophthora roreri]|nr:mannitol-1-phosphate 5-dehydrogenase [Moniliophthora roreri]